MNLYRVYPDSERIDTATAEGRSRLAEWYQPVTPEGHRLALISTPGGKITGIDQTSSSLSTRLDRLLLSTLRSQADAVITGAATIAQETVPVPAHAPLVIVSRKGNLSPHLLKVGSPHGDRVIVVTTEDTDVDPARELPEAAVQHIRLNSHGELPARVLSDELERRGFRHLLFEGGMRLTRAALSAGVIGELCLTLTGAPRHDGHPPLPWWERQWGEGAASSVATDDNKYLYLRYQIAGHTGQD